MHTVMRAPVMWRLLTPKEQRARQRSTPQIEETPGPWMDGWYGFCTWRQQVHRERGEHVAAMIWWALRFVDRDPIGSPADPCTDEGAEQMRGYWDYKMPITMREQDDATKAPQR